MVGYLLYISRKLRIIRRPTDWKFTAKLNFVSQMVELHRKWPMANCYLKL